MYGGNGTNILKYLYTQLWHVLKHKNVVKNQSIGKTIETIRNINPDVVAVMEVLGKEQRKQLTKAFKKMGFKSVHHTKGHGMHEGVGNEETVIATKEESKIIGEKDFPVPAKLGFGSGLIQLEIGKLRIIQAHLPQSYLHWKKHFMKQVDFIANEVKQIIDHQNVIVMGDFNIMHKQLVRLYPLIKNLNHLSVLKPTWPRVNWLNWSSHAIDHIYGDKTIKLIGNGTVDTFSDHALIYVDVEV